MIRFKTSSAGLAPDRRRIPARVLACLAAAAAAHATESPRVGGYILEAGHPSLAVWQLPAIESPARTELTSLGRRLFFEAGLSADGNMSCASCHVPEMAWTDGRPVARGRNGRELARATPTVLNAAYNDLQAWDGRFDSLEAQAIGPITDDSEMGSTVDEVLAFLMSNPTYREDFAAAFPKRPQPVSLETLQRAIAAFERTVTSRDSRFDRWVSGDREALTPQEVDGFAVFLDPARGNCAVCHAPPNFTDNGFHNIGLASFGEPDADPGRYAVRPVALMRGAFKTPTLREVAHTAPYFHDGSAATLDDVIQHYVDGGVVVTNLSPTMTKARVSSEERRNLLAFLRTLTGNPRYSQDPPVTAARSSHPDPERPTGEPQ